MCPHLEEGQGEPRNTSSTSLCFQSESKVWIEGQGYAYLSRSGQVVIQVHHWFINDLASFHPVRWYGKSLELCEMSFQVTSFPSSGLLPFFPVCHFWGKPHFIEVDYFNCLIVRLRSTRVFLEHFIPASLVILGSRNKDQTHVFWLIYPYYIRTRKCRDFISKKTTASHFNWPKTVLYLGSRLASSLMPSP